MKLFRSYSKILLLILCWFSGVFAAKNTPVVLFPFLNNDIVLFGLSQYQEAIVQKVSVGGGVDFIPYNDIIEVNGKKQKINCNQINCEIKYAESHDAQYFISGSVERRKEGYLVKVQLQSVAEKGVVAQWTKSFGLERLEFQDNFNLFIDEITPEIRTWLVRAPLMKLPDEEISSDLGTVITTEVLPDTLYEAKSPYRIQKSVAIPALKKVYIEPGVQILMADPTVNIYVYGQLLAIGSEKDPIVLRSAKKFAQPGDWGKIVFNSTLPSQLNYVDLMHSAYGIQIMHSSVNLSHVRFLRNQFVGIYAFDANLTIDTTRIFQGHQIGMQVDANSKVILHDLYIKNNNLGLQLADYSKTEGEKLIIENNKVGASLEDTLRLVIQGMELRENEVGLQSTKLMYDSLKNLDFQRNSDDVEWSVSEVLFNKNMSAFQERNLQKIYMTSLDQSERNLLKKSKKLENPKIEVTGLEEEEMNASIGGSITWKTGYVGVNTPRWTGIRPKYDGDDTVLYGQKFRNDFAQTGLFHNANAYMTYERGNQSLEMNMDLSDDQWTSWWFNPVYLNYTYARHAFNLGDFTVSGHDWVLSGRNILGVQYQFLPKQEQEYPYWSFQFFYGENQRPLYPYQKNIENYSEFVKNGNATAQKMMQGYKAQWFVNDMYSTTVGGVLLDDRRSQLTFGRDNFKEGTFFKEPIQTGRTFYWFNDFQSFSGQTQLKIYALYGEADTLNLMQKKAVDQWMSDNNMYDSLSLALANYLIENPSAGPDQIAPYIESSLGKTPRQVLTEIDSIREYYQDSTESRKVLGFHNSFENMAAGAEFEIKFEKNTVNLNAGFLGNRFYSAGSPGTVGNSRIYGVKYQGDWWDWWSSYVDYSLRVEQASDDIDHPNLFGFGEGSFWGFQKEDKTLLELDPNRVRPSMFHEWSAAEVFKLTDHFEFRLDYSGRYTTQYQNKEIHYDSNKIASGVFTDPYFAQVGSNLKMEYYGDIYAVDSARWALFNSKEDWANDFEERRLFQQIGFGFKYNLTPKEYVQFSPNLQWYKDFSEFHNDSGLSQFNFADTTWSKIGYYFNRINSFTQEYPVTVNFNVKDRLQSTSKLKWRIKEVVYNSEKSNEYTASQKLNFTVIQEKLFLGATLGWRYKISKSKSDRFYLLDSQNQKYIYLNSDIPSLTEESTSEDVNSSTTVSGYQLKKERAEKQRSEKDMSMAVNLKYNITSRWTVSSEGRYSSYSRPENSEEEYSTWMVSAGLNWGF